MLPVEYALFTAGMDTAGYLNLAADFIHNFTDGIAIGRFQ